MKPLVCIGFAEALSGPEVVWSLVDAGFEVVAFGRRGRRSALRHSRYARWVEVTPPESDFSATLREVQGLLNSLHPGVERAVLPLDDSAVLLCSHLKYEGGSVLAGPHDQNAALALDKWNQIQNANRAGLKVPETVLAMTPDDVYEQPQPLPVVLKPANAVLLREGRLQKGRHWICADRTELERAVEEWRGAYPLLVQPYIPGVGEGIFGIASCKGIQAWSAHRRLRMMNPHGSGSSACVSESVPEDLKRPVTEFIRQTEWRGIFMLEFLRDHNDTPWFVELNGRTWGSTALSRRQGMEYPAWGVQLALNPQSQIHFPEELAKELVCRNAGREFMHLLFVLRGPRSKAITGWPKFWRTLADVMRVRRGNSFYNWRTDDKRVFLSDCWATISANLFKSRH